MRNVTACPVAGLSPTEPFDVTPYAAALSRHFLRHALTQSLPRKFKIAFDGCANEGACVGAAFHDIAAIASVRDGRRGFRFYVGGGLGNTPKPARLFEEWTDADELLRTSHAIVELFDEKGNRKNRNRARLKFLIADLGWDAFQREVLERRERHPRGIALEPLEEKPPTPRPVSPGPVDPAFLRDNVQRQKQPGFHAVTVLLPLGDITSAQLRGLADIAALYADGRVRLTRGQNVLLRWVSDVPGLWRRLRAFNLAEAGAGTVTDITACPGADTCNLGITSSKGLAHALRQSLRDVPSARDLTIKISGCPNSCGQHHVADIGLHGATRKIGDAEVPCYNLLVGGSPVPVEGDTEFGVLTTRVAARLVPAAVIAVADVWSRERAEGERFRDFIVRAGIGRIRDLLAPFEDGPAVDWGSDQRYVANKAMKGECAV